MNIIQTQAPRVRIHAPAIVDRFTAAHHDQDALREKMAAAIAPEFRGPRMPMSVTISEGTRAPTGPKTWTMPHTLQRRLAMLRHLANHNYSRPQIAVKMKVPTKSLEDSEKRLVREGMIVATDAIEGRSQVWSITPAGRKALKEGKA